MDDKHSRHSWLNAGLEQLAAHGPDGLRIMAIAEKLGVTKGSFYWHFRDRPALLAALLEEWEKLATLAIIDEVEAGGGGASAGGVVGGGVVTGGRSAEGTDGAAGGSGA